MPEPETEPTATGEVGEGWPGSQSVARAEGSTWKHRHQKRSQMLKTLRAKLRGTWNYYGLIGNYRRLKLFYEETVRTLHKWLNRRSQRQSVSWRAMNRRLERFQIPRPRIVDKTGQKMPCQQELSLCQRLQPWAQPEVPLRAYARAS